MPARATASMTASLYTRWAPPNSKQRPFSSTTSTPATPTPEVLHERLAEHIEVTENLPPLLARRNKLKKRKRELNIDEEAAIEPPKKHKAVLSKFEKSSELVRAAQAQGKLNSESHEPQDEVPAKVLHGTYEISTIG